MTRPNGGTATPPRRGPDDAEIGELLRAGASAPSKTQATSSVGDSATRSSAPHSGSSVSTTDHTGMTLTAWSSAAQRYCVAYAR
mgnify:CR=1 FL=1